MKKKLLEKWLSYIWMKEQTYWYWKAFILGFERELNALLIKITRVYMNIDVRGQVLTKL